jgi:hypothetical protein
MGEAGLGEGVEATTWRSRGMVWALGRRRSWWRASHGEESVRKTALVNARVAIFFKTVFLYRRILVLLTFVLKKAATLSE